MMVDGDVEHIPTEKGVRQVQLPDLELVNEASLLMQVDQESTASKQEGIRKQISRIKQRLRSPSKRRQALQGLSINLGKIQKQGKRKMTDMDVAMENVENEGHEMKRNKQGAEGEGSIPNRTPDSK